MRRYGTHLRVINNSTQQLAQATRRQPAGVCASRRDQRQTQTRVDALEIRSTAMFECKTSTLSTAKFIYLFIYLLRHRTQWYTIKNRKIKDKNIPR